MEASTRVIPLLHHYPVSTEPEKMWEHGNVMLGFDAEERLIQKLPHDFAAKVVWGSRYPHHDATNAWDALARLREANVPEPLIAHMMGGNAVAQFAIEPRREPAV
jgi:hypothetical protein